MTKEWQSLSSTLATHKDYWYILNKNLEEQAQAIYKSWFVDFEPFGGIVPSEWDISTLGEVSTMSAGGDKPEKVSSIPTSEYKVPIYSNGISNEGLYGFTDIPRITEESITVSARGTIGFVCLRQVPFVPIVRLVTLIPNSKRMSAKYLYLALKQMHIVGTGTTQQQLTVPDFKKREIITPLEQQMHDFTRIITPMFDQILENKIQNQKLSDLRDTLLPKLMSGELDVSELDI